MPDPMLRGGAAVQEGDVTGLFDASLISHAIMTNLGNSSTLTHGKPVQMSYGGWKFPVIPEGVPTTIIPVAFPVTRAPTKSSEVMTEHIQLVAVFCAALIIWMLPTLCINKKLCSQCFRKWISRRLGCYFFLGLILNVTAISIVIARAPHIEANALFFTGVKLVEKVIDKMQKVLVQFAGLGVLVMLYVFRKKIATILGLDQMVVKADLRDILTGFSMKRFKAIEVSIWNAEGLSCGFSSRTLYARVTLGYNEPAHTRPHDNVRDSLMVRERIQLNYDEQDESQKLSIMLKQQEVIGASVNQLLPAAGALLGAVGGMTTPVGAMPGAAMGVITGTGAANSVGAEVARVDLSSAMINRIRQAHNANGPQPNSATARASATSTVRWSNEFFQKVDLVPQGELWLRICDLPD